MANAKNLYGTYGSVPEEKVTGTMGGSFSVRSTEKAFGAQIGAAVEGLGKDVSKVTNEYVQQAVETKVNDILTNQWSPTTAKMLTDYESSEGAGKIIAYENYVNNLKSYQNSLIENEPNPEAKRMLGGFTARQVVDSTERASRSLAVWQKEYGYESRVNLMEVNSDYAASNYNNPAVVNSIVAQNDAQIMLNFTAPGSDLDINSPEVQDQIQTAQRDMRGNMAIKMITRAVKSGDVSTANSIRSEYGTVIPGYQQLHLDDLLSTESLRQTSVQGTDALERGAQLPQPVGAAPLQVQSVVANTAQTNGVDINHALTIVRIESSNGQNLGKRGTIGQTGSGVTLDEQAADLVREAAKSKAVADKVLGRPSTPWEQYICYQQGAGGGPALLKAASDTPSMKAVDVLTPLYKSRKLAMSAIVGNGGQANITAQDFTQFIKEKYDKNYKYAACEFPKLNATSESGGILLGDTARPGDMIMKPYETLGDAVQPAATPMKAYINFVQKAPMMIEQINSIPNLETRDGMRKAFQRKESGYKAAAEYYESSIKYEAQQLGAKPDFTSTNQIPPELRANLVDLPETMEYLEKRADNNVEKSIGRDAKTYGQGFPAAMGKILTGEITRAKDIEKLYLDNKLTASGHDDLQKRLIDRNSSQGSSKGQALNTFLKIAKNEITNDIMDIGVDAAGQHLYLNFMTDALALYDKGVAEGKTDAQLLNNTSSDYIGKIIPNYQRTNAQKLADTVLVDSRSTQTTVSTVSKQNPFVTAAGMMLGVSVPSEVSSANVRKLNIAPALSEILRDVRLKKISTGEGRDRAFKAGLTNDPPPQYDVPRAE